jgi:malonyl-CoA O-methyltransferase
LQFFPTVPHDQNSILEGASIRRSFDRAASSYDQAAALQRRVADRLVQLAAGEPARVVDAGSGTGYGTAGLLRRFPQATLFALDLAPGMLHATRARTAGVPLVCADIQSLPLAGASVDLLWSSLMLQWCNRTDLAFAEAQRCLCKGGHFVFSTFGPATLHELRDSFADARTHVSRFPDVDELRKQLVAAGFAEIRIETQAEVLAYPDVRSLMLELKAIGAHNATAGRARGLTGKRSWAAMLSNYESRRSPVGLPATYELFYVSARRI